MAKDLKIQRKQENGEKKSKEINVIFFYFLINEEKL